ncbi:DUF1522 domain-containing protein [Hyphomicrobiales bacterium 4NK60-0047b]
MAGEITLSSAVRSNLLALQDTASLLSKTQEKLATGLKVNSALDDPTAFFTASSLNSRANDLSRLQDFVGNAVQTIKAADEGISAITKLVESAEATARQALQSAGQTATATGTVDTTASGFDSFTATSTSSNTVTTANFDDFAAQDVSSGVNFSTADLDLTATVTGSGFDTSGSANEQLTISDGTNTTADITIANGENVTTVVSNINSALTAAGITNITASDNGGQVELTSTDGVNITVADGSTTGGAAEIGLTNTTTNASNALGLAQGDQFSVNGTNVTYGTGTGEFNSASELTTLLSNISGISASIDGSNNLQIDTTDGSDLVLADVTNNPLAALGLTAGTTTASNTLGAENGDSFDISVGSGTATTITFGTGTGEVNTTAELLSTLNGISGVSAEIDGSDNLVITSTGGENLTFAENSGTPLADLGITAETVEATSTSGIELGDTFTVQVGSAAATTITFGTGSGEVNSADEVLAALNAITDVTATVTDDGFLSIEATNGEDLILAEGTNTPLADYGLTAGTTAPTENTDRTAFATQFNELRTQIDQLAADASFNGINLLTSDSLTVTFNEDATSSLSVSGVDFDANGLGISSATDTFQTDASINAAVADLNSATDTLRSQASKFGSNLSVVETRQDFTKNLINVLETGAANLTLADTNEEGANLLALQTRQQLSSTALSLASQADQNVLRLF